MTVLLRSPTVTERCITDARRPW